MQRVLLVVVVALLVWFAGCLIIGALQSDEDQVKERLQEICASFNDKSARGFVEALTDDYRDEVNGHDRSSLRAILGQYFASMQMNVGTPHYWMAVDDSTVLVTFSEERADRGSALFRASMTRWDPKQETPPTGDPAWTVEVTVQLQDVDGEWLISHSDYETLTGRQPLRP